MVSRQPRLFSGFSSPAISSNIAIVIVADAALVVLALFDERVLGRDERYRAYCSRVGWHLVPGVF